ncbi:MAG: mechanosensitive ion channel family protein [Microbacterium sp.]
MSTEIEEVTEAALANPWIGWLAVAIAVASALAIGLLVSFVFSRIMGAAGRRAAIFAELRARFPRVIFWAIATIGTWVTAPGLMPAEAGELAGAVEYVLRLCVIGIVGWIIAKILILFVDGAIRAQDRMKDDPFTLRRRRTQIRMIRRLVIVLVIVLTVGAMLLTIPGAETFGASLLASAGLASIVAGIAAQSTLGNLIAGLQLAFSNAMRTGDTVEVNGEYGTVEEITLTYVVVQIWDDRRLVLPSTYFTTTPYMNWTRSQTAVTGTVYLEVDFAIDLDAMRDELEMILDGTPLWDRRSWGLVMTDAVGGVVQLRASLTAVDADTLWSLRCLVREKLVAFVARTRPEELAHSRILLERGQSAQRETRTSDTAAGTE